jgi:hypothetical protein
MGLMPRRINAMIKTRLLQAGFRYPKSEARREAHEFRHYRKIPTASLVSRLGLSKYYGRHTDECADITASSAEIKLRQHIGVPAVPIVQPGDRVTAGQKIAESADSGLSVPMHSSIDGIVVSVTDTSIVVRKGGDEE